MNTVFRMSTLDFYEHKAVQNEPVNMKTRALFKEPFNIDQVYDVYRSQNIERENSILECSNRIYT